jgi:hypothetical protein
MKKLLTISISAVIICLIGFFMFGRSNPPVITISNNSIHVLKDVILIGSNFEKHLADIEPQKII